MEEKDRRTFSCADCGLKGCRKGDGKTPPFCPGDSMPEGLLEEAMAEYEKEEVRRLTVAAAEVEAENYCRMNRVQEIMEFARKIGAEKIGIATCIGLLEEAGIAARIFRKNGFEVFTVSCKCGKQLKVSVGIPEACEVVGKNMCNPVLQAKYLNAEKTQLDVVIGLCVGHDSLFYRYAEAPVTTLVTKDRVLGHNPVVALYQADKYMKLL